MTRVEVNSISKTEVLDVTVKLSESVFLEAIRQSVADKASIVGYKIESVTFKMPSGGDYSGMSLNLDDMDFRVVLERKTNG